MRWTAALLLLFASAVPADAATTGFYVNPDSSPAVWVRDNPDDPPAKRLAAVQYFRQVSQSPGARKLYVDWRKGTGGGGA